MRWIFSNHQGLHVCQQLLSGLKRIVSRGTLWRRL